MRYSRGQGFLALIFFIGTIVVAIGATLVFLVNSSTNTIFGYQAALRAEAIANSGVYDALLQLERDATFSSGGYTVTVDSDTAAVMVTQSSTLQTATIVSTSTIKGNTKAVTATVSVNTSTNQVRVTAWNLRQ